jgi:hypothetical protein
VDGTQYRFLRPGFHPAWSPDGTRIAFDRDFNLYVMNADGSGEVRLADGREPAWSPDGTKIAFSALTQDSFGSIYVMNADGTDQRKVTASTQFEEFPDWQPLLGPQRSDYQNAAEFCNAERAFLGEQRFRMKYGGPKHRANAYGKCVSRNG